MAQIYRGTINAPDFPKRLDWFNTAQALTMNDLRGRILILHFWTHC